MGLLNQIKRIFVNNQSEAAEGNRVLYLHMGMGKTGSKWLQKYWGLNKEYLQENGIYYPLAEHENPMDSQHLTPGTGLDFISNIRHRESVYSEGIKYGNDNLLISSEFVFNYFLFEPEKFKTELTEIISDNRTKVKILLFIRNTEELILSSYKQFIKVGKRADAIMFDMNNRSDLIQNINYLYSKYLEFIEFCENNKNIELTLLNYSNHKNELESISSKWLGIEINGAKLPSLQKVNRSLTAGECYIIEQFSILKNIDLSIGEELTAKVEDVFWDPEGLEETLIHEIWEKTSELRTELHKKLDPSEHITKGIGFSQKNRTFSFTESQLQQIIQLLN